MSPNNRMCWDQGLTVTNADKLEQSWLLVSSDNTDLLRKGKYHSTYLSLLSSSLTS